MTTGFSSPSANKDDAPRPAATVLLLRDRPQGGFEVLLVRRHSKSAFMAGAYVFPGGKLDDADLPSRYEVSPARAEKLASQLSIFVPGEVAAGLFLAAVREVFEESGVLLARKKDGAPCRGDLSSEREGDLAALLQREDLTPDLEALAPWAHWITPSAEPRRFDTWFFLAEQPADQTPSIDRGETVDQAWLSPQEAIDGHEAGRLFLPPPTWLNLEELSAYKSTAEAIAAARTKKISPVLPKVVGRDGKIEILMPWDGAYASAEGLSVPVPEPHPNRRPITRVTFEDGKWIAGRG